MLVPVILSGGAGTRLWPVSREAHPKPFIKMADGESLLLKTLQRAIATGASKVLTVTNRDYYFITRDEYSSLELASPVELSYLLEPAGRNTAPAIAAAAFAVQERFGEDAVMLVLPADHLIRDTAGFVSAVAAAERLAGEDYLVTFGITPAFPETGFGYIEAGDAIAPAAGAAEKSFHVRRFVEKPSLEKAEEYLHSGQYYWNSGMFCFRAGVFLAELARSAPQVHSGVTACWQASARTQLPLALDAETFARVPDISVDYAVMEKAPRVAVVVGTFDWSDIGSWQALAALAPADAAGNRISGEAIVVGARDCYIRSEDRVVAAIGVNELLVVDTPDALLIAHRDQAQQVKAVVQQLNARGHESTRIHRTVHRPWGTYTVLGEGPRFKIKRIVVKPGATLSLQKHHHRSEHWVVVSGSAVVTNGENETFVRSNESAYISAGVPHRLANPGVIDCVMIEVQSGDYLGEDDIVRLEDSYGRT
jgi:mannose-1-phosphate guanylyltransferase/mannose-6-phosphate isomerase